MAIMCKLKDLAKAALPDPVITSLRPILQRVRKKQARVRKYWWAWRAPMLHERLLAKHRGARPIRVLFLMSNTASWKVGPVFEQMMRDPDFQPIAVVCPVTNGALSTDARHTAELACRYLDTQGFPYVDMTRLDGEKTQAEIRRIDPHLVFFTNPHRLVPVYLHDDLLMSRLTCYVPYNHEVMAYGDNQEQYNQDSHNAFWRIFVPHEESRRYYKTARIRSDHGVSVTGFPACEPLLAPTPPRDPSPWKLQEKSKIRAIYAPHWLWRPDIKMATIDTFGETIMYLAEKYRDNVQWALRPHPMLKPRLMKDSEWGQQRTETFFEFWEQSDFCQIHEQDYLPLFQTSDAMIHDSGSFLAEYLYLRKPVMYLMTEQTGEKYFNPFGRRAIAACDIGRATEDVERFLETLLTDNIKILEYDRFFKEDILPHFETAPSLKICNEIKCALS